MTQTSESGLAAERPTGWDKLSKPKFVFALGGTIYVLLRLWSFVGEIGKTPAIYPDTQSYERAAHLSLFGLTFFTTWKPWGLPLFYKLLPGSTGSVVPVVQWLFSVAAWLVLALVVASFVNHERLKLLAAALVLAFSLVPIVTQWDGVLLTESLALSLAALLVAAMLALVRNPTWRNCALALVVALGSAALRDTNALLMIFLLVPLGIALLVRCSSRVGAVLACGTIALAALSYVSQGVRRWEIPLASIIARKILPDPDATAYFKARGMPVRPGIADAIFAARVPESRFEDDPSLAFFRPWFLSKARGTYTRYLISHPSVSLWQPIRNLSLMISPTRSPRYGLDFFKPKGFRTALPRVVTSVLYPGSAALVLLLMLFGLVFLFLSWVRGIARSFWLVPLLGLASTVPHAMFLWDGDWYEVTSVARHSLLVAIIVRLSLLTLIVFVADAYLTRRPAGIRGAVAKS